jgi:hypothetical protein
VLQGCRREVVVYRHGHAGYGSVRGRCTCWGNVSSPTATIAPLHARQRAAVQAAPAPVAQRIEHRPPEPVAQVRVLPGALNLPTGEPSQWRVSLLKVESPDTAESLVEAGERLEAGSRR